jgi:Protein of unknown function (DUF3592)
MNMPKDIAIGLGLMMVVGLGLLLGGIYEALDTREFLTHSRVVHGVVVDRSYSVQGMGDRGQRLVTPQIEYLDAAGNVRTYRPSYRSSHSDYVLGQSVALYVRDASPVSPERVRMIHVGDMWFGPFVSIFIGGGFTASVCVVCYVAWPIRIRKSAATRRS